MKEILNYFWQLSLLKANPEQTPYSQILMGFSAITLGFIMCIQWMISDFDANYDFLNTAFTSISLVLSYFIYTYVVLFFRGLASRWVQTITDLFCTHSIIHLLASPLVILAPYLSQANLKNPLLLFIGVIYLFVTLGLSVWQFVITAHIYKSALDTTSMQSVLAAFGLIATNILTVSLWR